MKTKKLSKLINLCILIVTIIFAIVDVVWLLAYYFGTPPKTVNISYVNTLTDQNGDEVYFLELNNYTNVDGSGAKMTELIFNYYTDYKVLGTIESYGIQRVEGADGTYKYYYYKKFADGGYKTMNILDREDMLYVAIEGKCYAVSLDGTYDIVTEKFDLFKPLKKALGVKMEENGKAWRSQNTTTYNYSFLDFFKAAAECLTVSSYGYGDYVLPIVDLAQYFSLSELNETTGQFEPAEYTTNVVSYFGVRVHNDKTGVVNAAQSRFKIVADDFNYNTTGLDFNQDYWKYEVKYTLSAADFKYVYNPLLDGYVMSIDSKRVNEINGYSVAVDIVIDLRDLYLFKKGFNVKGIAAFGLYGFKLNSITLKNGSGDFHLLAKSLWDTGLKKFDAGGCNLVLNGDVFDGNVEVLQ